jgi:hypothetical protein
MCKWSRWGDTRIDPCMREFIRSVSDTSNSFKTLACCCGHGKYHMTIVAKDIRGNIFEMFSGVDIPRAKRFYRRDNEGIYYIPEAIVEDLNDY